MQVEFPFALFRCFLTCLITDCFWLTTSTCMCHCFICNNLLYVPVDCFVEVASAGFYFGCKVKHLLSCSVSTGSIQRVIIALVYSVNVCQMDCCCCCCSCMYREGSSLGKKGKEKGGSTLISSFSFTSMVNSWLTCCSERC